MAYEQCPECGTRKHQIVACPACGFRRSAKLWNPRPKNALGKKPALLGRDETVAYEAAQKPMIVCSRCHELIEHSEMEKHMLSAHVSVVKKRKNRRITRTPAPEYGSSSKLCD